MHPIFKIYFSIQSQITINIGKKLSPVQYYLPHDNELIKVLYLNATDQECFRPVACTFLRNKRTIHIITMIGIPPKAVPASPRLHTTSILISFAHPQYFFCIFTRLPSGKTQYRRQEYSDVSWNEMKSNPMEFMLTSELALASPTFVICVSALGLSFRPPNKNNTNREFLGTDKKVYSPQDNFLFIFYFLFITDQCQQFAVINGKGNGSRKRTRHELYLLCIYIKQGWWWA